MSKKINESELKIKIRKRKPLTEREYEWAENNIYKECKQCLQDKVLKHYYKMTNGKYGKNRVCSECRKVNNARNYEEKKEVYNKYYEENQEKRAEYYQKNREDRIAYQVAYNEKKKHERQRLKLEEREARRKKEVINFVEE